MTKTFHSANIAYEYYHDKIIREGVEFADTKALFNIGFYIEKPMDNFILNGERGWNPVIAKQAGTRAEGDAKKHYNFHMIHFRNEEPTERMMSGTTPWPWGC